MSDHDERPPGFAIETVHDPEILAIVEFCAHDQLESDPAIAPCTDCGVFVEYHEGHQDEDPAFTIWRFTIHEEEIP